MSQTTTTVAIPATLRDVLAARVVNGKQSQDALVDTALRQQFAVLAAEIAQNRPMDGIAAHYLTDPRLASAGQHAPTVHIKRDLLDQAATLAEQFGMALARSIPKGRVIQALLWAQLDPLSPDAPRLPPPAPTPWATVTVNIPTALNKALLERVAQQGRRTRSSNNREVLISSLLTQAFADLDANVPGLLGVLAAEPRVQASDGRGGVTIRVQRQQQAQARALAGQIWGGVTSYVLQALLWYGLDHTADQLPIDPPDRSLLMSGALYDRVAQLALAETPRQVSPTAHIRAFVEAVVTQAVERAEQRNQIRSMVQEPAGKQHG